MTCLSLRLGAKIEDECYQGRSSKIHLPTLNKNQCLDTCETKIITGCEFENILPTPECIFHTKYIFGARLKRFGDYQSKCWRFAGKNLSMNLLKH